MSFLITVYTHEGIVMASDSRISYTTTITFPDGNKEILSGAHISDTAEKTFLCNAHIGLSVCGDSTIQHRLLAGYIRQFLAEAVHPESTVSEISKAVIEWFSEKDASLKANFIVAGYGAKQEVCRVYPNEKRIDRIDTAKPGATWAGETDIMKKLLLPTYLKSGDTYKPIPSFQINFDYFTLQDAVDFAKYAATVTMQAMAFQNRPKTVGGPIDILAIKPDGAFWIAQKKLHA